ncbi:right-handed parallel beta-helix repeat-containing protein [Paeniglutamicibacter sp.]|uniref:right-handed parallel beta-helix repeat-containing protein n=1 Tax=Paeniglutamicibacter sp. TaxID=1934391 RepID=UPI0039899762
MTPLIAAFVAAGASPGVGKTLDRSVSVTSINVSTGEILAGTSTDTDIAALIADPKSLSRTAISAAICKWTPEVFTAGAGDQTAELQAFLNSLPAGRDAEIRGTADFTTLTINTPNIRLRLAPGAVLNKTHATSDGVVVNASNVTIEGGKIKGLATWDGTNVSWTYAMIHVKESTGNNTTIRGVTLENVHKVGIGVRADAVNITDCRIVGNYPASRWTGVEVAHFGITLDPTGAGMGGAGIISNNHIRACVQGISLANFGGAVPGYGYNITGNSFEGCHNHGVYAQHGIGNVIDGNTFNRCQIPVVVTGKAHVVSNNTMFTSGTGARTDMTGISVREPDGCIIEGNTIFGDSTATNIGISVDSLTSRVVRDTIVRGNVVKLTGHGNHGIRVGQGAEVCSGNIIEGNVLIGGGLNATGTLLVTAKTGFTGMGNIVRGNRITQTGIGHGISIQRQKNALVTNNHVSLQRNATARETITQLYLDTVTDSVIAGNLLSNPPTSGANVSLRGIQEDAASNRNAIIQNTVKHDTTLLVRSTAIFQIGGAASIHAGTVGDYASATRLGTLSGKVPYYDRAGVQRGFIPVYTSIA